MDRLARIFAIVLLAAFAAGTVSHAATATDMSVKMSAAGMDDGSMGDCTGCPDDDGKAPVCDQLCMLSFVAILAAAAIELPFVAAGTASSPLKAPDGHAGPPEPSPPRTIILS